MGESQPSMWYNWVGNCQASPLLSIFFQHKFRSFHAEQCTFYPFMSFHSAAKNGSLVWKSQFAFVPKHFSSPCNHREVLLIVCRVVAAAAPGTTGAQAGLPKDLGQG